MPTTRAAAATDPLYAMGLNFSMTGVFYNKELAAKIGMTEAPETLAKTSTGYLQAAKDAGITPIAQFNGGATGGLLFPLQGLMASYGITAPINNWIFQTPDATIDTADNLAAAEHLQGGSRPATSPKTMQLDGLLADDEPLHRRREPAHLQCGTGRSGNLDTQMAGNAGFFLMPPLEETAVRRAMSAPLTYGISAYAENPTAPRSS